MRWLDEDVTKLARGSETLEEDTVMLRVFIFVFFWVDLM